MKIWWDWDQYGDWVKQKLKKYAEEEKEALKPKVEEYLRQFNPQNYNYIHISHNEILSQELIREFADFVDWKEILKTQTMCKDFMREFRKELKWTEADKLMDWKEFDNDLEQQFGSGNTKPS